MVLRLRPQQDAKPITRPIPVPAGSPTGYRGLLALQGRPTPWNPAQASLFASARDGVTPFMILSYACISWSRCDSMSEGADQ